MGKNAAGESRAFLMTRDDVNRENIPEPSTGLLLLVGLAALKLRNRYKA